jgi:hypothetical protein
LTIVALRSDSFSSFSVNVYMLVFENVNVYGANDKEAMVKLHVLSIYSVPMRGMSMRKGGIIAEIRSKFNLINSLRGGGGVLLGSFAFSC